MSIVLAALAVFWVLKVARVWVDAPSWLWTLAQLPLAFLALLPWQPDHGGWVAPLAASAIVTFVQHTENFLIAKGDEAVASVMRRR